MSLPSWPAPNISIVILSAPSPFTVKRTFEALPVAASFIVPAYEHDDSDSQVPQLIMGPVDMLSIQMLQYFFDTLSNPFMPVPSNGPPIIWLLTVSFCTRPPSVMLISAVP